MASLGRIVVEQSIRLSATRREAAAWRELLCQALALLADRDRELKAARSTIEFQRLEIRAIVSGRTIAEQRQSEDRAA